VEEQSNLNARRQLEGQRPCRRSTMNAEPAVALFLLVPLVARCPGCRSLAPRPKLRSEAVQRLRRARQQDQSTESAQQREERKARRQHRATGEKNSRPTATRMGERKGEPSLEASSRCSLQPTSSLSTSVDEHRLSSCTGISRACNAPCIRPGEASTRSSESSNWSFSGRPHRREGEGARLVSWAVSLTRVQHPSI
jgi:hypothetical protein